MRIAVALCLAASTPLLAQQADWVGPRPSAGGIGLIEVRLAAGDSLREAAVGQVALALDRSVGGWRAFVPIPIEADSSVRLRITVAGPTRTWPAAIALPIDGRTYPSERLSVDPRFTDSPTGDLADRIARERRQSAALIPIAMATPRLFEEAFAAPASSAVTSGFGTARLFNGSLRSRHTGTDFQGGMGDSVRVANRGIIALIGDFYYSGRIVYVNHGIGLVTAYLHLSDVLVAVGDTVTRGQVIGRMGASGRVTGPHLHWMVRVSNRLVDGLTLLALPGPAEPSRQSESR